LNPQNAVEESIAKEHSRIFDIREDENGDGTAKKALPSSLYNSDQEISQKKWCDSRRYLMIDHLDA
jgi:hypothetical protein